MKPIKKDATDHGLYSFRIDKEKREELNGLVDSAKTRLNKNKLPDEYVITKGEILYEAIKIGLRHLKRT